MLHLVFGILKVAEDRTAAYLDQFENVLTSAGPESTGMPYMEVRELNVGTNGLGGEDLRQARIRERFGVTVVSLFGNRANFLSTRMRTRLFSRVIRYAFLACLNRSMVWRLTCPGRKNTRDNPHKALLFPLLERPREEGKILDLCFPRLDQAFCDRTCASAGTCLETCAEITSSKLFSKT